MRIVAVSDLHRHFNLTIPTGDVLVVAGDISGGRGSVQELVQFNEWLGKQPHATKLVCAGNHDVVLERDRSLALPYLTNATYVEDQTVVVDGIRFWGSPYSKAYGVGWGFQLHPGQAKQHWAKIPTDTDVLFTHGPAYGILDEVAWSGEHAGDLDLLHAIDQLQLKACICGHIHRDRTQSKRIDTANTVFANVSVCDDSYNAVNPATVIDL